jgi:hypothetical protein
MEKFNLFKDDIAGFCTDFSKVGETVTFKMGKPVQVDAARVYASASQETVHGLGYEEQHINGRCCE